jgi:hypothetical protein
MKKRLHVANGELGIHEIGEDDSIFEVISFQLRLWFSRISPRGMLSERTRATECFKRVRHIDKPTIPLR